MTSPHVSARPATAAAIVLTLAVGPLASMATAQSITGTATFRERMALPPGAILEVTLEDVSRAGAPAESVASTRITSPGNPPIGFALAYDPARIRADHRYSVRARIVLNGKLLFTTDSASPVITGGNPISVSLSLRRVSADQTTRTPVTPIPFEGTIWRAIELAGKPTPAQDAKREAQLVFQDGSRVFGSDGCNRITGNYKRKAEFVTFDQVVGTQMACTDTGEIERAFRDAVKATVRLTIVGDRVELFDAAGKRMAAFVARAQATPPVLAGTSWQLVKFQGGDDTTLVPDERAKYTIAFGSSGRLTVRVDCNRGQATWKTTGTSGLEIGPLAIMRAKCAAGSLHDRIVKQWPYVRSYLMRDGHLFLSLMADGGIYEFEPSMR
jgi:putative lipoprotein